MKEAESTVHRITSTLTTDNTNRIPEQVKTNTQRVFNTTKDRQKYKFEKLLHEKQAAVSPSDTPYVDKTNWVLQQLSYQSLTSRRNCETRSKTSKRTIPSWFSQRTKGRASVVMNTNTYHAKMSNLIENGSYQLLQKDPTDCPTRKLSEKPLALKQSGHLSEAVYNKIRPQTQTAT